MAGRATVGLDLSYTNTGLALFVDGAFSSSGSALFSTKKSAEAYDSIMRANSIARDILRTLQWVTDSYGAPKVWIEGYAYGAFANRERLGELGGIVKTRLLDAGFEYEVLPVTVVRKFVCGKGNARKEMVLKSLLQRYDIDLSQNDLADAAALGLTGAWIQRARDRDESVQKLYADARTVLETLRTKNTREEHV